MCPYWLEIAVEHLSAAARARDDVFSDREGGDSAALERVFSAGMQALTSGAVALDALRVRPTSEHHPRLAPSFSQPRLNMV